MRNESCGEMSLETSAETTLFPQVIKIGHHEKKERSPFDCILFQPSGQKFVFLLLLSLFFLFCLWDPKTKKQHPTRREQRERERRIPSSYFPHTTTCCVFPIIYLNKKTSQKSTTTVIYIYTHREYV